MLWLQRRFLSRFTELLRTEVAQTYFQMINGKLNNFGNKGSVFKDCSKSSCSSDWETVTPLAHAFYEKLEMLKQLNALAEDGDREVQEIAKEDRQQIVKDLDDIAREITDAVIPVTEYDLLNNCQIEITPGVGGIEASLFASELTQMYRNYAQYRKWSWTPYQMDITPYGGVRSAIVFVRGEGVFRTLRFEGGVHRVQRVPATDKTRMHTSTSVVAVLPEPERIESCVTYKDVKVETMRASGPGGQNVNQRDTAVRLTHHETGISVHCMDERTQHANMEIAFKRLAALLLQRKMDASQKQYSSCRKLQVGTKARAEKVRTYNFKDDQVTDHRLNQAWQSVSNVMKGGSILHEIVKSLDEESKVLHLEEILGFQNLNAKITCNV